VGVGVQCTRIPRSDLSIDTFHEERTVSGVKALSRATRRYGGRPWRTQRIYYGKVDPTIHYDVVVDPTDSMIVE
jgi:hypothetical protein